MYRNDSLVEPSLVVLCSSSSLEFQKTHPQHSEPPKMEDSIYRLHVFMVRSNICRKCPNMQCSKKFTSHAYHTIWCCRNPQGQQPRNVNKNPCCYMGRISTTILPQLGFRWSRISFSKKPQRYALKTLLLCHARVFRRKLRRVTAPPIFVWPWRRSCSSSRAPKRTYRRNSRKGPGNAKPCFFQMDGKWWFFKPTIFSMVKMWESSNCKLQEAFLPSGPRWEFYEN